MPRGPLTAGPGSRAPFAVGLVLSLLLHAGLLRLPTSSGVRRDGPPAARATSALALTLRPPLTTVGASPAEPRKRGEPATPAKATRQVSAPPVRAPRPASWRASTSAGAAPALVASDTRPRPGLNLEDLRAQARDLARRPAEPGTHVGGEHPAPQQAAPDLLDRPLLEALSRRLGKPLRVASEQRLADGSWMIRFTGNVCLNVPAHLPLGQENPFGPTVRVPTNCPD